MLCLFYYQGIDGGRWKTRRIHRHLFTCVQKNMHWLPIQWPAWSVRTPSSATEKVSFSLLPPMHRQCKHKLSTSVLHVITCCMCIHQCMWLCAHGCSQWRTVIYKSLLWASSSSTVDIKDKYDFFFSLFMQCNSILYIGFCSMWRLR